MPTVAVMMVRDELDILESTLCWLVSQVDQVRIYDNGSTDGTREFLDILAGKTDGGPYDGRIRIEHDAEPGYWQSRKMTAWARDAYADGFDWIVPVDADEVWYSADGRPLNDVFDGLDPGISIVTADLFHHIPTALDNPDNPDPIARIGWRKREVAQLPKVACRLRPDLTIEAGNHGASTDGTALDTGGLLIRHFSWRSPEQYLRKMRNGYEAYSKTDLPAHTGAHWRMWGPEISDAEIGRHFFEWYWSEDPDLDTSLVYDPSPHWRNNYADREDLP